MNGDFSFTLTNHQFEAFCQTKFLWFFKRKQSFLCFLSWKSIPARCMRSTKLLPLILSSLLMELDSTWLTLLPLEQMCPLEADTNASKSLSSWWTPKTILLMNRDDLKLWLCSNAIALGFQAPPTRKQWCWLKNSWWNTFQTQQLKQTLMIESMMTRSNDSLHFFATEDWLDFLGQTEGNS